MALTWHRQCWSFWIKQKLSLRYFHHDLNTACSDPQINRLVTSHSIMQVTMAHSCMNSTIYWLNAILILMSLTAKSCNFICHLFPHILMSSFRCFPHVINICCDHVITKITDTWHTETETMFADPIPQSSPDNTFEDTCKWDPIALGCDVVWAVRASGLCWEHFDSIIDSGSSEGFFFVGNSTTPVQVQHLQLLRDVKTRWDSIYFMIRCLCIMCPVCYHLPLPSLHLVCIY